MKQEQVSDQQDYQLSIHQKNDESTQPITIKRPKSNQNKFFAIISLAILAVVIGDLFFHNKNKQISAVDLSKEDSQGKKIQHYLYHSKETRQKRIKFHQERIDAVKSLRERFPSLELIKYNMKIDSMQESQQKTLQTSQYQKLNTELSFQNYPKELQMCIIVTSHNNQPDFRIQYNLNSIFTQNYTNYIAVIINDASTDNSHAIYTSYFTFHQIDKLKYRYISNSVKLTAVENYYRACSEFCGRNSIVVSVDGDDQLVGKNVLKVFNVHYQKLNAGAIYSNFYYYMQRHKYAMDGFTSQYTQQQRKSNRYRQITQKFSHLKSFKNSLFLQIKKEDLQDKKGEFYKTAYDFVIYLPIMELSCGKVYRISGVHYLYNSNTGMNDNLVDQKNQVRVEKELRGKMRYGCFGGVGQENGG